MHLPACIEEAIRAADYLIRYLPPYSPDYNPIELSFSILKSWIKRNYYSIYPTCSNFGEFYRF